MHSLRLVDAFTCHKNGRQPRGGGFLPCWKRWWRQLERILNRRSSTKWKLDVTCWFLWRRINQLKETSPNWINLSLCHLSRSGILFSTGVIRKTCYGRDLFFSSCIGNHLLSYSQSRIVSGSAAFNETFQNLVISVDNGLKACAMLSRKISASCVSMKRCVTATGWCSLHHVAIAPFLAPSFVLHAPEPKP
jgi:hypothetical protein